MQFQWLGNWLVTANREERLGLSLLWLILGCISLSFAIPAFTLLPYLLDGEVVQGSVLTTPSLESPATKFGPKYVVRFEYLDASGKLHVGEGRVHSTDAVKLGDRIAVRYNRSAPSRSRLDSSVWNGIPSIFFAVFGMVVVCASIVYGISGIRGVNGHVWPARPV